MGEEALKSDPFAKFKAVQRESWALFAPLAAVTTPAAAALANFVGIRKGEAVLDVACGTGVVAITAHRRGARVSALDLSPVLLEEARKNAAILKAGIDFKEGDVEALPYQDDSFDVVLSQFGHMFAPRPELALKEMLRVLKAGGRIAFSTWPPELMIGRMFALVSQHVPPPPGVGAPGQWGDPTVVRERLNGLVDEIVFHRNDMLFPALSPQHYRASMELTAGPVIKAVETLAGEPEKLQKFRGDIESITEQYFIDNVVRQSYLMTRAVKR